MDSPWPGQPETSPPGRVATDPGPLQLTTPAHHLSAAARAAQQITASRRPTASASPLLEPSFSDGQPPISARDCRRRLGRHGEERQARGSLFRGPGPESSGESSAGGAVAAPVKHMATILASLGYPKFRAAQDQSPTPGPREHRRFVWERHQTSLKQCEPQISLLPQGARYLSECGARV